MVMVKVAEAVIPAVGVDLVAAVIPVVGVDLVAVGEEEEETVGEGRVAMAHATIMAVTCVGVDLVAVSLVAVDLVADHPFGHYFLGLVALGGGLMIIRHQLKHVPQKLLHDDILYILLHACMCSSSNIIM